MTLKIDISPDLEKRLKQEAHRHGVAVETYVRQLLDRSLATQEKRSERIVDLLQSWIDAEDDAEQKETGDYLIHVLDEDRLSNRKLYPPELKGITW